MSRPAAGGFPPAPKSPYHARIAELAPAYDPTHVEAFMRVEHSTLDWMDASRFRREVAFACDCIDEAGPEMSARIAASFGFVARDAA